MPVEEVNCQDRKKHHGSNKPGSLLSNRTNLISGFCENKSCEGLTFLPAFFCLFVRKFILSTKPRMMRISLPFPERLSKLFNIPVYSTFPLLVISKPWVLSLSAAAVHSRKFYFPEGLGISEGPWMKDYESACELVRAALFLVIMSCSPPYL